MPGFYDYSPSYVSRGFTKGYEEGKPYYVAYVDNDDTLQTVKVYVEGIYTETPPHHHDGKDRTTWYAKIHLPREYYPTFMHKWFDMKSTKYEFLDDYIIMGFVQETEVDAKIAYLNIMKIAHRGISQTISRLHDEFGDEHPDLYWKSFYNGWAAGKSRQSPLCAAGM